MVKIRLSRFGRKKAPFYRIVAVEARSKRDGKVLEYLGFWNPDKDKKDLNKVSIDAWVKKGAQVSASVQKLLS